MPEQKLEKNRVHLDIAVDDIEGAVLTATGLGAQRNGVVVRSDLGAYQVMCDPEGNEFCLVSD